MQRMLHIVFCVVILHGMADGRKGRKEIGVMWRTSTRSRAVTLGEGLAVLVARPGPLEDDFSYLVVNFHRALARD